jgi:hypothetical protein
MDLKISDWKITLKAYVLNGVTKGECINQHNQNLAKPRKKNVRIDSDA